MRITSQAGSRSSADHTHAIVERRREGLRRSGLSEEAASQCGGSGMRPGDRWERKDVSGPSRRRRSGHHSRRSDVAHPDDAHAGGRHSHRCRHGHRPLRAGPRQSRDPLSGRDVSSRRRRRARAVPHRLRDRVDSSPPSALTATTLPRLRGGSSCAQCCPRLCKYFCVNGMWINNIRRWLNHDLLRKHDGKLRDDVSP